MDVKNEHVEAYRKTLHPLEREKFDKRPHLHKLIMSGRWAGLQQEQNKKKVKTNRNV